MDLKKDDNDYVESIYVDVKNNDEAELKAYNLACDVYHIFNSSSIEQIMKNYNIDKESAIDVYNYKMNLCLKYSKEN